MVLEFTSDGILQISPPDNFRGPETLTHAQENIKAFSKIPVELIQGILAFLPKHYINSDATRAYNKVRPMVPIALVSDSRIKTMMGNILLTFNIRSSPMKLFSDEKEALKWLHFKTIKV